MEGDSLVLGRGMAVVWPHTSPIHDLQQRRFPVRPGLLHQLLVRAGLRQPPVFQHENHLRMTQQAQPAGNNERRAAVHGFAQRRDDLIFRARIHRRRRIVQHENGRLQQQRPGQRQTLPLATR